MEVYMQIQLPRSLRYAKTVCFGALMSLASIPAIPAQEQVVLNIDGKTRDGGVHQLSMADLERMPQTTIRTTTPWHDHVVEFQGVKLSYLMDQVGAEGETAFVLALNEYSAEVPVADFATFEPILATVQDGQAMSVGDKGPLFIVYPYDDDPQLHAEKFYLRSVWSVASITIE
jgi:hypothetical protein